MGDDPLEIFQSPLTLIDSHHAFGIAEVHGAKRVSHNGACGVFFGGRHGVFQVEDVGVGAVKSRVEEHLGLVAGQVEPAATEAVASTGRKANFEGRQKLAVEVRVGPARRRLQTGVEYEGHGTGIFHFERGVLDAQRLQPFGQLRANGFAEHDHDLALQFNFHAAALADF